MKSNRNKIGLTVSIVGVSLNVLLAVSKMTVGALSGMISIVADGINNLSDAISNIVSLVGFGLSAKPADDEHPFGHARYEYISGLIVSFLVLLAGVELLQGSVEKIIAPSNIKLNIVTICVLAVSITVKAIMMLMYNIAGKKTCSQTIIAASKDSRNDCITTCALLIAAVFMYYFKINIDGYMGVAVALFILVSGVGLVISTVKPLLGTIPEPKVIEHIENKIMSYEGVLGVHDLMIHDYGPGNCFASIHVEVPSDMNVRECHSIIDRIEHDFLVDENINLLIHYDPVLYDDDILRDIHAFLEKTVREIDERITIHDLRVSVLEKEQIIMFDCVVPKQVAYTDDFIVEELTAIICEKYPDYAVKIKIDHSIVSLNNK